jgi:hypothetical protein
LLNTGVFVFGGASACLQNQRDLGCSKMTGDCPNYQHPNRQAQGYRQERSPEEPNLAAQWQRV